MLLVVTVVGWALIFGFALRAAALVSIDADVRAFQIAYVAGFAGYIALVWVVLRATPEPGRDREGEWVIPRESNRGEVGPRGAWGWWLVGCVAVRALLLPMQPSDDIYRYVWEGRIQVAGFNPYTTTPDDPQLAHLRDDDWSMINHPDYPAIYPPVAQIEFLAVAGVARVFNAWAVSSVILVKLLHVLWDVLTIVVLGACLRRLGRPPHLAIIYGLCPLVLTAFAIEAHLDSLMLLFTAGATWALLTGRIYTAGAALGLAIGSKLVFAVLLVWLVVRHWKAAVLAVAVVVFAYVPYLGAGSAVFESLRRFSASGEFFSLLGTLGICAFETEYSRGGAVLLLFIVLLVLAWRRSTWPAYALSATGALLLLMPIVHYWYFAWVFLFLPFTLRLRWIVVALALVVYFEAALSLASTGNWQMPAWAPVLVWTSFLLAWVLETLVRRESSSHHAR